MKKQENRGTEQRFVRRSIRWLVTLVNQAYRQDPGFLSLGNTKYGLLRGALSLMRNCSWTRFDYVSLRNARRSINYRPVKGVPSLWKWSLIDWYIFLWWKCRIEFQSLSILLQFTQPNRVCWSTWLFCIEFYWKKRKKKYVPNRENVINDNCTSIINIIDFTFCTFLLVLKYYWCYSIV